ncbi:hypothetical protein Hsar01_01294 [Haloferula sargassicola]|uniref:Peptidase S24/S26A/S26B/S26C domain-containing protein n=1 Tax=Haloferula sargassicola TaxID=490096 RepID=A0ABP9ULA5_9BACT
MIGWAHAGEAVAYEELPGDWQNRIPTECRDPKAFAVSLEGDSMAPEFRDGQLLVLMPSEEAYSGCFVVCRFKDDGVLFRRIEFAGEEIVLHPLNPRYDSRSYPREAFAWIYPVWGSWAQLWKR